MITGLETSITLNYTALDQYGHTYFLRTPSLGNQETFEEAVSGVYGVYKFAYWGPNGTGVVIGGTNYKSQWVLNGSTLVNNLSDYGITGGTVSSAARSSNGDVTITITLQSLFEKIFKYLEHTTQTRVIFGNGDTYDIGNIYGASLDYSVLPNNVPGVGGTNAKQLSVTILPKSEIGRGEQVQVQMRVSVRSGLIAQSEWIPKGTFFVDTREISADGLRTTFHCYDAMLKGDADFMQSTHIDPWDQNTTDADVVADIATILGVPVDPSNVLGGYTIQRPVDGLTVREVLGYIGALNGGNFIVSEQNKLKLIKLVSDRSLLATEEHQPILFGNVFIVLHTPGYGGSTETNVGRLVESFTDLGVKAPYTGVRAWYTDEDCYEAGTEDGSVLEFVCPWATQASVNAILAEINGFVYHPYEATKAELIPIVEMGDVVGVNGAFAPMYSFNVTLDGGYWPNIGAPSDGDQDYEYPYVSKAERADRRAKKALTAAQQIANGTYQGGTFIDGTLIYAPQIYGGAKLHVGAIGDPVTGYNFNVDQYGNVSIGKNTNVTGGYNFQIASNGDLTSYGSMSLAGNISMGGSMTVGGSITLQSGGNINLSNGTITWSANNSPVKVRYSPTGTIAPGKTPGTDNVNWHDPPLNTTTAPTDLYVSYSYNGGVDWTAPVLVKGTQGPPGSDANVTFDNVNSALATLFHKYSQGEPTSVSDYCLYSPIIEAGHLYTCHIYTGDGNNGVIEIGTSAYESSMIMYNSTGQNKLGLGYAKLSSTEYPLLRLGTGSGSSGSGGALSMKLGYGLWVGDSSIGSAGGNCPGGGNSCVDISSSFPDATGLFIDFSHDQIWRYIGGVPTEITQSVAVFG